MFEEFDIVNYFINHYSFLSIGDLNFKSVIKH